MNDTVSEKTPATPLPSRVLAAPVCLLLLFSASGAWGGERQYIHNTVPAAVTNAAKLRPSLRLEKLNLAIGLPLRNQQALSDFLRQIYDPTNPNFRHYLTPEQFTEKFGPTESDYEAVVQFAHDHGLTVTARHSNRLVVSVRATVLDIERAFHISLDEYQHPTEDRTFRAPNQEPSLDLAVPVLSIAGLDNYIIPKPCLKRVLNNGSNPKPATGSGPSGAYESKDFRAAYLPGVTQTGTGQAVGLLEFASGFYQSDITAFEAATGAPNVPVNAVLLDGYNGGPGQGNDEVSLDIEMAIGMAPGLQQVLVYEGDTTDNILNRMATDNLAKQLSASWTYTLDATSESIFKEFAAQGQSYFNASGDGDAYVGAPPPPTDDTNITVVGGTTLSTSGALGSWTGEVVWNDGGGQGTGGGISTRNALPVYQQGISMAANGGSTVWRNSPDVAACANNVYVYYGNGLAGAFVGTSCASPTWAAFIALANQLAVANNLPTVGFLNPLVYSIGKGSNAMSYTSLFHDITSGNNEWSSSPTKFVATTGYDLCTGWGSPANTNLLGVLAFPEPLRITPSTSVTFNGPAGGPFSPAAVTYSLTNNSSASLNWSVSAPPTWLEVSPTNGTLVPGAPATAVTLRVAPSATNLALGAYNYTLAFTDLNDHVVQSLSVTLGVVSPPVITIQPTNESDPIGGPATLSVGVAADAVVYYQWRLNGTDLTDTGNYSGSATANLNFINLAATNDGTYSVIVSNAAGVAISSNAVLSVVNSLPIISQQPTNFTALPGSVASFSVQNYGTTPFFYHWMLNGTNLANGTKYGGVSTSALSITNCVTANAGAYSVLISNSLGSVTSSNANLSLAPTTAPGIVLNPISAYPGGTLPETPFAPVVYDAGNYWGTSINGGNYGGGTAYRLAGSGAFTVAHSFAGTSDGALPYAGLCLAKDGNFYGMAIGYGTYGDGTIFKETTAGIFSVLTQFDGDNGSEPVGNLMQAADGNLYGTANVGGAYGYGTIFRVSTTGSLTLLGSFDGTDGAFPSPTLVQGKDGNLYGTSENGGIFASGAGTLFSISTNGFLNFFYSFGGTNDGAVPIAGMIQGVDGNFYGVTLEGGPYNQGTVFQMQPSGEVTTLYAFTGGSDGGEPWGGLVQASDGNLYGTTQQGGTYGLGTVFRIAPTGTLTPIAQFDGYQGATPEAGLIQGPDHNLYGTTAGGGSLGFGVFYSVIITNVSPLQITGQPADLSVYAGANAVFAVATAGGPVTSYQWQQNGANLANGGSFSGATSAVLTISNVSTSNVALYNCVVASAANSITSAPAALAVTLSGPVITSQPFGQTNLAGSTAIFAVSVSGDQPLTYQWQENGVNLANGGNISGATTAVLTITNLALTNAGSYSVMVSNAAWSVVSSNAQLAVLPANAPSITFSNLHFFAGGTGDGDGPSSALIQALDGNLYGATASGGADYTGTLFRMTTGGTLTTIHSFGLSPNSGFPVGGLAQTANGNLFGVTQGGGTNGVGVFYKVTSYSSESDLNDFSGTMNGSDPDDSLLVGSDGNLYGTAFAGGGNNLGSVFRATSIGVMTVFYSFTGGNDGASPYAGLIQGTDGSFYGTTTAGGAYGFGTAFKLGTNGVLTPLAEFDFTNNGAQPFGGLVQAKDGNFYGTTSEGGPNGFGTVFRLSASGHLSTLYSFSGDDGAFPIAGLIQGADGNLYGVAEAGGVGGWGIAFLISTNGGALNTLLSFDGFNGATPEGGLLQASNGTIYGTTTYGGVGFNLTAGGGYGTVFEIVPPVLIQGPFSATNAVACLPYSGTLLGTATPPTGDTFSYSLLSGPSWLTVATNGLLSGAPTNSNLGTNTFEIGVTDSSGFRASTNLQIVVIPDPAPTFLTNPIVETPALAGKPYSGSIAADATAPYLGDGDVMTFAKVSGPAWLSFAPNGALSGTPASSDAGTNTFVVSATDLGGSSNTASVIIDVVLSISTPPVISLGQLTFGTNGFRLAFSGPQGQTYTVLSSSNIRTQLSLWTIVSTGAFGTNTVVFVDPRATNNPSLFYTIRSP